MVRHRPAEWMTSGWTTDGYFTHVSSGSISTIHTSNVRGGDGRGSAVHCALMRCIVIAHENRTLKIEIEIKTPTRYPKQDCHRGNKFILRIKWRDIAGICGRRKFCALLGWLEGCYTNGMVCSI